MPAKQAQIRKPKRILGTVPNVPCPVCHGTWSTWTGTIGTARYFCADCCTEFTLGQSPSIYAISSAGTVQRLVG